MEHVVSEYLSYLDIPISKDYCEKCVVSHPDYPSLLSVADTLERLGIHYRIARIRQETLADLSFPYILHFDKHGGTLAIIRNREELETHAGDMEHWDGVVVKASPSSAILDNQHNKQYAREKLQRMLATAGAMAFLGLFLIPVILLGSWLCGLLFATSAGGAAIGYFLLAKDVGITYKPVETFCNAGKRTNCDRILHARDAQLFGFFTFTDAAASYFGFQVIAVGLFVPLFNAGTSFLAVLAAASIFTIPVIGYSLYYQAWKANTWCRLCLLIDAILIAQGAIFATMYYRQMMVWQQVHILPASLLILLFTAIASLIILSKDWIKTANKSAQAETVAKRVKHDPEVFRHLLLQKERVDITPFKPEILIGDEQAPINVLMVINLHCNPCRVAYKTVMRLLASYPRKICFTVRLTRGMDRAIGELSASTYLIRYWQQYIDSQKNPSVSTRQLLHDWYEQMDPVAFTEQYPQNGASLVAGNGRSPLESQHYGWIKKNNITGTPSFFVNGHKMPRNYRIQDFPAFVPGLASLFKEDENLVAKSLNEDIT